MTTATAERAQVKNLAVTFGNLNVGDETARLGVTIDRGEIGAEEIDEVFCGSRIEISVTLESDPDQGKLPGHKLPTIKSVCDSKGYSASTKRWSLGLTFTLKEVDVKELTGFAKRGGKISATRIGDADQDDGNGDE